MKLHLGWMSPACWEENAESLEKSEDRDEGKENNIKRINESCHEITDELLWPSNQKTQRRCEEDVRRSMGHHYKEGPCHTKCPVGPGSWCSFQRDVAYGTQLHKPIKNHYLLLSWRKSPCVWENDQRKLSECECRFFQGIYCKSPISPLPCLNVSAFPVTSIICRYKSLLMISIISMITQRGHSQQCPTKWGAPGAPPAGSSSPCRQVKYNTRKKMKPFSKKESVWQATGHTVY